MTTQKPSGPDVKALNRYTAYDPVIGFAKEKSDIPGYDIWPDDLGINDANVSIMVLGGSTSTWPVGCWSRDLGKALHEDDVKALVFNGGVEGYSSNQELLKVLRDAPSLKPDVVLSLSGVNDIAFLHVVPQNPLVHLYQTLVGRFLVETTSAFVRFDMGVRSTASASEVWLRNSRFARLICAEYDIPYFSFLQPTMVYGGYKPGEEEKGLLDPQAYRILETTGLDYIESVAEFYDEIRNAIGKDKVKYSHVHDLTQIFAGKSGLYRDYRHQNEKGDGLIAEAVFKVLRNDKIC